MKWVKKGRICSHASFDLPWYKKNTMVPLPFLIDQKRLRVYLTFCDAQNVGRIGYVDVDPLNPSRILDHSRTPVLDVGDAGCFDDNGVITASLIEHQGKLILYYSGYELKVKIPYTIFGGAAISSDGGATFQRVSKVPFLDRTKDEPSSRCAPIVVKEGDLFKMWYTGDHQNGWTELNGKKLPLYYIKYLESTDPLDWGNRIGKPSVFFQSDDEHGIAKPSLWKDGAKYKMIYSIRSFSKGYRMGYAESDDGVRFQRMDDQMGLDVSATGWDSEMVCFGTRFQFQDKVYLFYCGNKYGLDGFGYAELS